MAVDDHRWQTLVHCDGCGWTGENTRARGPRYGEEFVAPCPRCPSETATYALPPEWNRP